MEFSSAPYMLHVLPLLYLVTLTSTNYEALPMQFLHRPVTSSFIGSQHFFLINFPFVLVTKFNVLIPLP